MKINLWVISTLILFGLFIFVGSSMVDTYIEGGIMTRGDMFRTISVLFIFWFCGFKSKIEKIGTYEIKIDYDYFKKRFDF